MVPRFSFQPTPRPPTGVVAMSDLPENVVVVWRGESASDPKRRIVVVRAGEGYEILFQKWLNRWKTTETYRARYPPKIDPDGATPNDGAAVDGGGGDGDGDASGTVTIRLSKHVDKVMFDDGVLYAPPREHDVSPAKAVTLVKQGDAELVDECQVTVGYSDGGGG